MTLATICTNALREINGFYIPPTWYSSTNPTATLAVALANREGATLERMYRWPTLISTYTFTTVADTAAYDLPSDFRAFANMSQWDRTNSRRLVGPASGMMWQWLKGDVTAGSTIDRWFRIEGSYIVIHPTPTVSGQTIAFDYYSKAWVVEQATENNVTAWTADNDTSRIDEEILTMGVKWRFLQAKGMPFEPEYKEYESVLEAVREDAGGRGSINLGQKRMKLDNLPDTGYGS